MVTDHSASLDNDVRMEVYRSFAEHGHPPIAADIGRALGQPLIEVESSLARLASAHVLVLAPGTPYIWMANPFSALPTPFRARVGEGAWWGNCIWDAMGIVAMLGGAGDVEASCPDCGDRLEVELRGERLRHDGYVVHYSVPAARWWDDIGST